MGSVQFYIAIVLSVGAIAVWVMSIRAASTPQVSTSSPAQSSTLTFSLATLFIAWLVALLTPAMDNVFYKGAVLLGMLLALIAIALRVSGFLPTYAVHAHLLLTYALYGLAFGSQTSGWPTPWAILLIAIAGYLYYWFYPTLFELWSWVAIYALLIFLATWQALELALQQPQAWTSWAGLAGMLLMSIATLLEAQARFRPLRARWSIAALPVFLIAQLAIAWSVWG